MPGRHDISDDYEPVFLPRLFEDRKEAVACAWRIEEWQTVIARVSDKVQVLRTVSTMQAGRLTISWYRQHRSRPCKNRKSGAPIVSNRKVKSEIEEAGPRNIKGRSYRSRLQLL